MCERIRYVKSRMSRTFTVLRKKTELTHILITILGGNMQNIHY